MRPTSNKMMINTMFKELYCNTYKNVEPSCKTKKKNVEAKFMQPINKMLFLKSMVAASGMEFQITPFVLQDISYNHIHP